MKGSLTKILNTTLIPFVVVVDNEDDDDDDDDDYDDDYYYHKVNRYVSPDINFVNSSKITMNRVLVKLFKTSSMKIIEERRCFSMLNCHLYSFRKVFRKFLPQL